MRFDLTRNKSTILYSIHFKPFLFVVKKIKEFLKSYNVHIQFSFIAEDSSDADWLRAEVSISASSSVTVQIIATKDVASTQPYGDIALDDIRVAAGLCGGATPSPEQTTPSPVPVNTDPTVGTTAAPEMPSSVQPFDGMKYVYLYELRFVVSFLRLVC